MITVKNTLRNLEMGFNSACTEGYMCYVTGQSLIVIFQIFGFVTDDDNLGRIDYADGIYSVSGTDAYAVELLNSLINN